MGGVNHLSEFWDRDWHSLMEFTTQWTKPNDVATQSFSATHNILIAGFPARYVKAYLMQRRFQSGHTFRSCLNGGEIFDFVTVESSVSSTHQGLRITVLNWRSSYWHWLSRLRLILFYSSLTVPWKTSTVIANVFNNLNSLLRMTPFQEDTRIVCSWRVPW